MKDFEKGDTMFKVTYCSDLATHEYSFKIFATKEEAFDWCKNHIGGLHRREYEDFISEVHDD